MAHGEAGRRSRRAGRSGLRAARGVLGIGLTAAILLTTAACGGSDDDSDGGDARKGAGSESSSGATAGGTSGSGGSGGSGSSGSGGSGGSGGSSMPTPSGGDPGAPGTPDAQGRQTDVFDRVPGSKSSSCVSVGDRRDIRSGGFVGGAFDEASKAYNTKRPGFAKKEVRLYWIPLHAGSMKGVQVTASSGGTTVKPTQSNQADADQWKFYDTTFKLPKSGTWTFKVSAGKDRGCFTAAIG